MDTMRKIRTKIDMNGEFILGDCMDYLSKYEDNHFDLCLTDPPYNVGQKYNEYNDNRNDYFEWCDMWLTECKRISKCVALTGGMVNMNFWSKTMKEAICLYTPAMSSPSRLGGFNVWEPVYIYGNPLGRIGHNFIYGKTSNQKDGAFHDCPKHIDSWKAVLKVLSCGIPNIKVLDPFTGSGTTLIACEDMGFKYVGFEIDKDYYEAALKRLNNHIAQLKIF